ncbi:MAG: glycosyltransferase family 39 protein [Endomicrobia bacterium]|nr:glycosyltransferase family 39 protein [Endomicrobiia bacterium]MCL2799483.1 glycosyltransferase family 39 protein [Endomicrobiia bacterium]
MKNEKAFKRLFTKIIPLLPYFFTALIAFAIYAKTINYGVTDLDDTIFIHTCAKNYDSPSAFKDAFEQDVFWGTRSVLYYRPMLAISFILDHKIAGESESFAHLTNVLLHAVSSILVLLFFRRYLNLDKNLSFLAAVLFAVHPIAVQTVAWIPGRNDSLFFIYFIACLICFIEYLRSEKRIFLLTHVLFLLFCLFTKESAVAVPFILFLYYIIHKNRHTTSLKFYVYIVWALCSVIFLLARKSILFNTNYNLQFEFGNQLNIAAFFDHIYAIFFLRSPMAEHKETKIFVLGTISVLISLFMAFYKKDKNGVKEILFYLSLPIILLLPNFISGDHKISRLIFHGNRMYAPLFAYLVIIFLFCKNFTGTPKYRKLLYSILISVIILSSAITLKSSSYLKDSLTFWNKVISENKESSALAIDSYINVLLSNNYIDKAFVYADHYAKESNYENTKLLYSLGKIYLFREDYESASKYLDMVYSNYSKNNKKDLALYLLNYLANVRAGNKEKSAYYYNIAREAANLTPEEFDEQFIKYGKLFDKKIEEIKRQKIINK